jgi:hypothetical protein
LLASQPRLFNPLATLFFLGDGLGVTELVDNEIPLRSRHDALDLYVLVTRRNDKSVALLVGLVVLGEREVDRSGAAVLSTLAESFKSILRAVSKVLARMLDFTVHRPMHGLIFRNALVPGIHRAQVYGQRA